MYGYHNVKWLIMSEANRNGLKDRGYAMKDHFSKTNESPATLDLHGEEIL